MSNTCRIGVGGPVGSGKTALIEAITPYFEIGFTGFDYYQRYRDHRRCQTCP